VAVLLKPSGVISRTWPHASTTLSHKSLASLTVDAGASCVHPVLCSRWANRTLACCSEVSILFLAWKGCVRLRHTRKIYMSSSGDKANLTFFREYFFSPQITVFENKIG